MIIVTAADQRYFAALINLVGSLHYWAPEQALRVYNLGLAPEQIGEIARWRGVELVNNFGLEVAAGHFRELQNYAWKPLVLTDAIEHHDSILWIDAGSDIRAPIQAIRAQLLRDGFFFVQGQDLDMTLKSHPQCYRKMNTKISRFAGRPHFAGSLQGYTRSSAARGLILEPMYAYAMQKACIAPEGSSPENHRFDQTVLSILIYQSGLAVDPATHMLAAHRWQLATSPLQPSTRIVHTARGSSIEYAGQLRDKQSRVRFPNAPKINA